jgi:hypothetical protein
MTVASSIDRFDRYGPHIPFNTVVLTLLFSVREFV